MRNKFILFLVCVFMVAFGGRAFADGNSISQEKKKTSIFSNILSTEKIVTPEELTPIPCVIQDLIDYLASSAQSAEEIKDNMALWATKQKHRMTLWRAHTLEN